MNARTAGTDRRIPAVLTDFDDTAAAQNVAELLLHEFGHPTWTDVRERFRAGELSLKDYQEETFLQMQADKNAMQSYVRANANFRPRFKELSAFCQANSIPMCIISQGLDFYIQALLDECGQSDMPVYAVATEFDGQGTGMRLPLRFRIPGRPAPGQQQGPDRAPVPEAGPPRVFHGGWTLGF